MPEEVRSSPEILAIALQSNDFFITNPILYALAGALTEENIDLALTKKQRINVESLTPELLSSKYFVMRYIEKQGAYGLLKRLPPEFQNDIEIVKALVSVNLFVFRELSDGYRNNPEVLKAALSGSEEPFYSTPILYALAGALTEENIDLAIKKQKIDRYHLRSMHLSNKYLVLKLMEQDVSIFKFVAEELQSDTEVISVALGLDPKMLYYVGSNALTNEMIDYAISNGLKINGDNIPDSILSSEVFVKRFLPIYPSIYGRLPLELRSNLEYIKIAVSKDIQNFSYVPDEFVNDEIIAFVLSNGYSISKEKSEIISAYIKRNLISNPEAIYSLFMQNEHHINDLIYVQAIFQSKVTLPPEVQKKYDAVLEKLTNRFKEKGCDNTYIQALIIKMLNGETDIFNINSINSFKQLLYTIKFGDLENYRIRMFVEGLSYDCLTKCNVQHYNDIKKSLKTLGISEESSQKLAFSIYQTIGYARAKDLLNADTRKNYGSVDMEKLDNLFGEIDLSGVLFVADGNKYSPMLNEQLINLMYGANYKVANTPIRNYLSGFSDMQQFISRETDKINNEPDLTPEDKKQKIARLKERENAYYSDIRDFIAHIGTIFNEWDVIEEEFIRKSNLSKLKINLNIAQINEIIAILSQIRKRVQSKSEFGSRKQARYNRIPHYEPRDFPLTQSDLFDYVGIQTQYTTNPELAPQRAVTLSRMMENQRSKKFPNVNLDFDQYSIKVFNPQDRDLLSGGYRSGCCFRPNGNADNKGENNGLLTYCAATEYGGGIEIRDAENKTLMFSPILRNGNVLMVHSVESIGMSDHEQRIVNAILKEWAKKVIEVSRQEEGDESIVAVVATNLHKKLDTTQCVGVLPSDRKFNYYDPQGQFLGMYNNLKNDHYILEMQDGKQIPDIRYDYPVAKSYEYPVQTTDINNVTVSPDELDIIKAILDARLEIIVLANERLAMEKENQALESFEVLRQIRLKKQENVARYKQLSAMSKDSKKDVLFEYAEAVETANQVCDELGRTRQAMTRRFVQIYYASGWYLGITEDNKLYGDYVTNAEDQFINAMSAIQRMYGIEIETERDGTNR